MENTIILICATASGNLLFEYFSDDSFSVTQLTDEPVNQPQDAFAA